jgi:type IV pilus assembly protein PilY1
MVTFPQASDITSQETTNDQIQNVILASRPYGATPLAGMFADAQYYFWTDPQGPQQTDAYVQGGCRNEYIIVLTDGAPNQDMRPACSATPNAAADGGAGAPGKCPYPLPDTTAQTLFAGGGGLQKVTTYVIGFAVSSFTDPTQGTSAACSTLVTNGTLSSKCTSNMVQGDPAFACCELERIAVAGGSNHAYFADTAGDLQAAIGAIFADIAKNTTTRTAPAYSPIVTNVVSDPTQPTTNDSLFLASFNPSPGLPWSGNVQRQRYQCTYSGSAFTVPPATIDPSKGDDFAVNLNTPGGTRTFVVLQPDPLGGSQGSAVDSTATIRPYVVSGVGDGLGKYGATTYAGDASTVIPSITPGALSLVGNSCQYWSKSGGGQKQLTTTQCRDLLLDFTFAQKSFDSAPPDFSFVSRSGNAFGDVFHATPFVAGPPGSLLRDDSYIGFRQKWAARKQIVYVATNDGLLHAFWADETKPENNELWAMLPPAVMPSLASSYPSSHSFLLDGSPIVKDVVWDRSASNVTDPATWHTMLVAGFGPSEQGYYAVDVTNPDASALTTGGGVPVDPPPPGPVFRWQLTKLPASTYQIFGSHSATPAITTLNMDPGDGKGIREIGVAILPGGEGSAPSASVACARAAKSGDSAPATGYVYRSKVRCWGANNQASDVVTGRSLAVVRVDTGEIVRVFTRAADVPLSDPLATSKRVTDTPLDSPVTGVPMVYPADPGTDATKVFIGDADGTIWKFDLSSTDPSLWTGELFLDLYNGTVDSSTTAWADGQPLEVTPVLSLDTAGSVVLNVASGTQATFDTTGLDYVYSVSEKVQGSPAKLRAQVNWWIGPPTFQAGERVSGPMTVFDGVFYFATYAAASGSQSCTSGHARLWGRDFIAPQDTGDLSKGGIPRLQAPQGQPQQNPLPTFIQPSDYDVTLLGKVIPGVSIKATPACGSLGLPGPDSYVYGAQHAATQNFSAGSYSLFTQVGMKGTSGATTRQFEETVPTPVSPTVIDSWAAVLE